MIALLVGDQGRLLAHAARVLELHGCHVLAADHASDAMALAEALPDLSLLLWTAELRDGPAVETAALIADRWPAAVALAVVPETASAAVGAALARVTNLRLCTPRLPTRRAARAAAGGRRRPRRVRAGLTGRLLLPPADRPERRPLPVRFSHIRAGSSRPRSPSLPPPGGFRPDSAHSRPHPPAPSQSSQTVSWRGFIAIPRSEHGTRLTAAL